MSIHMGKKGREKESVAAETTERGEKKMTNSLEEKDPNRHLMLLKALSPM